VTASDIVTNCDIIIFVTIIHIVGTTIDINLSRGFLCKVFWTCKAENTTIIQHSALRSSLKTGKRPEKDRKKTGPRLEKTGPAVRFFENLKQKTAKRQVYMDRSFVALNYPFKSSPRTWKLTQN